MIFYGNSISSNFEYDKAVTVETSISERGLPVFEIFGLISKTIEESKKRITNSFEFLGINFPLKSISINLSPAEFSKEGTHFDLAIAYTILQYSSGVIPQPEKSIFIGELSFDGTVKPVKNIIYLVLTAKKLGFLKIYVPYENLNDLKFMSGRGIFGLKSLKDLLYLDQIEEFNPASEVPNLDFSTTSFSKIIGSKLNKRILAIALAGKHHFLINGFPGSGKSLLAKSALDLMPELDITQASEVAKIHSFVGVKREDYDFLRPPFRSPHNSSSYSSIFGSSGKTIIPGELALANNGVLFLDEFPEFNRQVIEGLRAPLEDKCITISRAKIKKTINTDFILISAMNPCKCGFFNHPKKDCTCLPMDIRRYQSRISGPIMDRIDIQIIHDGSINYLNAKEELNYSYIEFTNLKNQIKEVRTKIKEQSVENSNFDSFENLGKNYIHCYFNPKSTQLVNSLLESYSISNRRYQKILKLSRTISLFEKSTQVEPEHVLEAISLSSFEKN